MDAGGIYLVGLAWLELFQPNRLHRAGKKTSDYMCDDSFALYNVAVHVIHAVIIVAILNQYN